MKKQLCATWQPIQTAPTDGTEVLAWCAGHETHRIAWFEMGLWWRAVGDGSQTNIQATHWMPLPQPPEDDQ